MGKKNKERIKEIIMDILVWLFMVGVTIFLILDLLAHKTINLSINKIELKQKQIEAAVKELEEAEKVYQTIGEYDDRVFEEEVSLDWSKSDLNFQPIKCKLDEDTQEFVYYLAEAYNIDFTLIMAIMKVESNYRPDIISSTNDYGLMQINLCNHTMLKEKLGINDFLDPEQNIRAGCYILRKLFEKHEDVGLVLMAYNMGESGANKLWSSGIFESEYSKRVIAEQRKIQKKIERGEVIWKD